MQRGAFNAAVHPTPMAAHSHLLTPPTNPRLGAECTEGARLPAPETVLGQPQLLCPQAASTAHTLTRGHTGAGPPGIRKQDPRRQGWLQ